MGHPGQQHGQVHGQGQQHGRRGRQRRAPAAFVGPMDHSYRNLQNGSNGNDIRGGFTPSQYVEPVVEPLPVREDGSTRIFAFIDDLFFVAKIQETARKLNVKVEFLKTGDELFDRLGQLEQAGEAPPSLIIFDLNSNTAKPLTVIPKVKSKLKKGTSVLGFLSHLQGELKLKAQDAGCDTVMPRSAFSQNLPQLLRRHGAPDDLEAVE